MSITFIEQVITKKAYYPDATTLTISMDNFLEMIKWELNSPVMIIIPSIQDIEDGRADFIGLKLKLKKGTNILEVN